MSNSMSDKSFKFTDERNIFFELCPSHHHPRISVSIHLPISVPAYKAIKVFIKVNINFYKHKKSQANFVAILIIIQNSSQRKYQRACYLRRRCINIYYLKSLPLSLSPDLYFLHTSNSFNSFPSI